jgi:hypothetical protein
MSDSQSRRISFDDVVRYMSDPSLGLIGDYPADILEDRLGSIGVQEAIEQRAIANRGFPFKYHHTIDEGILVLYHFLKQSRRIPGSYIQINSTHVPTKEEENTLSSWKSPKAGLYLDLHALIDNHNHSRGKKGLIKRVFVFRDHAQLAFLESTGIGVILEQESMGIETGFLLTLTREMGEQIAKLTWAGVMLVQLLHDDEEKCQWFLGIDKAIPSQQPYVNNIICKWHKGRVMNGANLTAGALQEANHLNLKDYLDLFRFENPGTPKKKIGNRTYRFENQPEPFRDLLWANYRQAFANQDVTEKEFEDHLNVRAIPENFEQFCIALERIKESCEIKAIDASSVKITLRVHEADPNYRHWIRTSVQRALKHGDKSSLERIYILNGARDEYEIFKQELDLYRNLMSGNVSRLDPHAVIDEDTLPTNIRLFAITQQHLESICRETTSDVLNELRELLKEDFIRDPRKTTTSVMCDLDFLYSERLIFNYKDYRGEPGRAFYDADLFVPAEAENETNIIKYLPPAKFQDRQARFARLFELLRDRSIQVLPSNGVDFSELEGFEDALAKKGIQPIVLGDIEIKKSFGTTVAQNAATVFVSHASDDRKKVDQIRDKLQSEGYHVWHYDWDIPVGREKFLEQHRALKNADFVLCCCSESYDGKPGPIQTEIQEALEIAREFPRGHSFVLVVRLDSCRGPEELSHLKDIQLFDGEILLQEQWTRLIADIEQEKALRLRKKIRIVNGHVITERE